MNAEQDNQENTQDHILYLATLADAAQELGDYEVQFTPKPEPPARLVQRLTQQIESAHVDRDPDPTYALEYLHTLTEAALHLTANERIVIGDPPAVLLARIASGMRYAEQLHQPEAEPHTSGASQAPAHRPTEPALALHSPAPTDRTSAPRKDSVDEQLPLGNGPDEATAPAGRRTEHLLPERKRRRPIGRRRRSPRVGYTAKITQACSRVRCVPLNALFSTVLIPIVLMLTGAAMVGWLIATEVGPEAFALLGAAITAAGTGVRMIAGELRKAHREHLALKATTPEQRMAVLENLAAAIEPRRHHISRRRAPSGVQPLPPAAVDLDPHNDD